MSKSTNKIIAMIIALVAATLLMTACSSRNRYYRVATIENWLSAPNDNGIEVRSLDKGYHVGDTLVNTHYRMHLEIIIGVAE